VRRIEAHWRKQIATAVRIAPAGQVTCETPGFRSFP